MHAAPPTARSLFWSDLRRPLAAALVVRCIAAATALGFHSRDDYFHVLAPAVAWLKDPGFVWEQSDLPGAGIRSHLLPRFVFWLLRGMEAIGITGPDVQLRALYVVMGLYSLWLVVAMYQAGLRFFGPVTARRAAWCAALFFVFPYAGTRLLIEALAMPPLIGGLAYLAGSKKREGFLGGALVGLAVVWRFQVAAVLPGIAAALWYARSRKHALGPQDPELSLAWAPAGFAAVLFACGAYDLLTTGTFLGPAWNNLMFNMRMPAHISRSAPWGYVGFWLLLGAGPLLFWLGGPMLRAARQAPLLGASWLSFVLLHSAIAHKEDRFMLPAVPLFALMLCQAWTLRDAGGIQVSHVLQRSWPAARRAGLAVMLFALVLGVTAQSQANLRDAMLYLHRDTDTRAVVSLGPELQTWFLGRPEIQTRRSRAPDEAWLQQTLIEMHQAGITPNRFVSYSADKNIVEVFLRLNGYACAPPVQIEGWWLDRWLARLNPQRNQRRAPILIHRCVTPDIAAT